MGSEVAIVDPIQGEVLNLDASDERLAQLLDDVRDFESRLRELKRTVADELLRRMDSQASWTVQAGDFKLTGQSPEPKVEYDGERLSMVLTELVIDGLISQPAMEAAVKMIVEYKPIVAGINKLRKLGGAVAEEIDACGQTVEKDRRVSVSRRSS